MKKLALIVTALSVVLLSTTVMATDFQALTVLQGDTPVQLQDSELATTEGGASCNVPNATGDTGNFGGVALCSEIGGIPARIDLPLKGANFIQVVTGGF
jgi:hypothetical protein